MASIEGKQILLLYAKFFNYDIIVRNKLNEMGAKVDLYDARAELCTLEKAILKVYKGFFYKKLKSYHNRIININSNKKYDIIFTNSYLPRETLVLYRRFFPMAKLILYLDDSVCNTKNIEKTFDYYDSVKTFDRSDARKYNIQLQPLFFEDSYKTSGDYANKYDLCFIGTIHSDRLIVISEVEKLCKENNLNFFHYCYLQSNFIYYFYWLTKPEFRKYKKSYFSFQQMSSAEVASVVASSKAILDIQHPLQTGLTMRTIEAIGSRKKILTTNKDVSFYDICNENVYIINREEPYFPISFLESPYFELSNEIRFRYSIDGWVLSVFV